MRFRKTIRLGKGIKLNISKSGLSTTLGGKGLSLNIGQKGAYLNTGIPGTGLSERIKIGGAEMSDKSGEERLIITDDDDGYTSDMSSFVPPYKLFGWGLSFLLFIIGLPAAVIGLLLTLLFLLRPASPERASYLIVFVPTAIIGILLYSLHVHNHRKAKKNDHALFEYSDKKRAEYQEAQRKKEEQYQEALRKREEARQALIDGKVNGILGHELFDGAKVFVINQDNIIAFSKQRHIALFTEKDDTVLKIIGVDHITKITQEIKAGACYAHIYTDDFDNNIIDLFIGTAGGKEETEEVRKLYNEIKGLYTALKKTKA